MKKITTILLIFVIVFSFVACKENVEKGQLDAYYGETFYVPDISGAEYELKDINGKSVELVNLSFVPASLSNYKLLVKKDGKKAEYIITVVDRRAPEIKTSYNFKYALAGTVELPEVDAGDSTFTIKVYSGKNEIKVEENAFEAQEGRYDIKITATSNSNITSTKTCFVQVTDNNEKLNALTAFEEEYGIKHFERRYSLTPEYFDKSGLKPEIEIKRAAFNESFNESLNYDGLTRLYYTSEKMTSIKGKVILNKLLIPEVFDYVGMYFYVYHDTSVADNSQYLNDFKAWVLLNETNSVELKPNAWTKVVVTNLSNLINNSGIINYKENLTFANINGLMLTINNAAMSEERGFYFTNFYLYK